MTQSESRALNGESGALRTDCASTDTEMDAFGRADLSRVACQWRLNLVRG